MMVQKILKIIFGLVAMLAGLAVLTFLTIKLISDELYKEWIVSATETATGRAFSIDELFLDINTSLLLKASDIRPIEQNSSCKLQIFCILLTI